MISSLYTITFDASTRLLHRHQPGDYIAGPAGEIDWLFTDQDYGYTPFYANVDTVVMGRKTYELCRTFAEYPYPGIQNYVWSRTRRGTDEHATFVSGDIAELLKGLKQTDGNTIWLVGGSALVGDAIKHDLLDELLSPSTLSCSETACRCSHAAFPGDSFSSSDPKPSHPVSYSSPTVDLPDSNGAIRVQIRSLNASALPFWQKDLGL